MQTGISAYCIPPYRSQASNPQRHFTSLYTGLNLRNAFRQSLHPKDQASGPNGLAGQLTGNCWKLLIALLGT